MADFLVLEELQDDTVAILQEHCDEKANMLRLFDECGERSFFSSDSGGYKALLAQIFRGVKTAYTTHPHSVSCQQVLVGFFHTIRAFAFGTQGFYTAMSNAPLKFSHDLFMATIGGGAGTMTIGNSEYRHPQQRHNCTGCGIPAPTLPQHWAVDLSMSKAPAQGCSLSVAWRCIPCCRKNGLDGYDHVSADEKRLREYQER